MRYYVIAGEASGDLHGGNLLRGLKAEDPSASFRFWGGDNMSAAAGSSGELVRHYRDGAVMGVTDVLAKAGKLLGNLSFCKKDILSWNPDVVILIDYPGFNMKIAEFCHKRGVKVFYYIAPKTWASRESRNRKLKAWVDKLFIVFPFEIEYFTRKGIPFVYKGNPLVDSIDASTVGAGSREDFIKRNGIPDTRFIAILPGSRKGEIERMMPVCCEAARMLHGKPEFRDFQFLIAAAPARSVQDYNRYFTEDYIRIVMNDTFCTLKYAEAAVINSGTASLEAALIGTPQVVGWSTGRLTAFVARRILRVLDHIKYISLGNLCLGKAAFRELIQDELKAAAVGSELERLVVDEKYRGAMIEDYGRIRECLGGTGASRKVARAMIDEF